MTRGLTLLLVLLLVLTGCGGEQPGPTPKPTYRTYVALGDSYTAGPGIPPVQHPACGRSEVNYPHLLAAHLDVRRLVDASCSASLANHLIEAQRTPHGTVEPPQGAHLRDGTALVTVGWGLNHRLLSFNVLVGCLPQVGQPPRCRDFLALSPDRLRTVVRETATEVRAALEAIRDRSPDAEIVLVGYPSLGDRACGDWPVPKDFPAQADVVLSTLDEEYEALAADLGVHYADVYAASAEHGICAEDPWVTGYPGPERGLWLHPVDGYHRAVAELVAKILDD